MYNESNLPENCQLAVQFVELADYSDTQQVLGYLVCYIPELVPALLLYLCLFPFAPMDTN
jgi:hypothetical protein